MELKERLDLLAQSANIAQQNGILSLDDAVIAKNALNNIEKGENVSQSVKLLVKIAEVAQSRGVFSLKDAFYMYMAIEGIDKCLPEEKPESESEEKGEE